MDFKSVTYLIVLCCFICTDLSFAGVNTNKRHGRLERIQDEMKTDELDTRIEKCRSIKGISYEFVKNKKFECLKEILNDQRL